MTMITTNLNPCIARAALETACGRSLRSHGQNPYWANRKQSEFDKNSLFLHSSRTRRLDAIRITRQRTFLFSCRGSSTFGDEYLSAVSSYPLRGWKQILAIYLIPPRDHVAAGPRRPIVQWDGVWVGVRTGAAERSQAARENK